MCKEYGYCRISRKSQNIERQVRNIQEAFPNAHIVKEAFTGTKLQGRKELDKLLKAVKEGDTIVFDSASRMSRNAAEAMELYESLYDKGINLIFLKEPHINSATYHEATRRTLETTGNEVADCFIEATNKVLRILAREQVRLAFEQAEKEVTDLHKRTSEGIETARLNGKQIGQRQGAKLNVKKATAAKEIIRKHNVDFEGSLSDSETIKLASISRNSFYKYKRELREDMI